MWKLADIDRDGKLDADEFAVAMYLGRQIQAGHSLPATLPIHVCVLPRPGRRVAFNPAALYFRSFHPLSFRRAPAAQRMRQTSMPSTNYGIIFR